MQNKAKRGRPQLKYYDSSALQQDLIAAVAEVYADTKEIKATALELGLPPNKVKKLLITGGILTYPQTKEIQEMLGAGKSMTEIGDALCLSYSAIHTYLPYTKVPYKMDEISQNAERVKRYKERKTVVADLLNGLDCSCEAVVIEKLLWSCIIAFQNYPFHTASGLPFSYALKTGQNGKYTKELFIDRRENSKSLSWSSVRIAFERAAADPGRIYKRPKDIGDVRGISYSYSLLWRFGVIMVPEDIEMKLRGR